MKQLVIASSNKGKISEIRSLFAPLKIEIIPQHDLGVDDIAETGTTFIENAILKARHACKISGLPALADDSGLIVPSLGGQPGIYSARYAGEHGNDAKNNEKLLADLSSQTNRQASFVCTLALCFSKNHPLPLIAQGKWNGEISQQTSGNDGFGYDPIFYVPSLNKTAAELSKAEKNKMSHRALALQALFEQLTTVD